MQNSLQNNLFFFNWQKFNMFSTLVYVLVRAEYGRCFDHRNQAKDAWCFRHFDLKVLLQNLPFNEELTVI